MVAPAASPPPRGLLFFGAARICGRRSNRQDLLTKRCLILGRAPEGDFDDADPPILGGRVSRPRLNNGAARRLFLNRHGLGPDGGTGTLIDLIDRLGFVQLDSVDTVSRAQHMILAARRKSYRPAELKRLQERQRGLFEHWTHDAAVIPMAFYPHWQARFRRDEVRLRARWRSWRREGFEERLDDVLAHVADHGPVMARDVGEEEGRGSGAGWWDWRPSKTALEFLWRTGRLAVAGREGFQKVFDLAERVVPAGLLAAAPEHGETVDWACAAALDRLGFATSGEIAAFWETATPAEAKQWCAAHLGQDLIEVEIEDADGGVRNAFARPDIVAAAAPDPTGAVRVLSPFDPALRDRKRAERLFGFRYRIEIFVPAEKRQYGYYVFPLLEGDRLIGRIDMKRDGPGGPLVVRAMWPELGVRMGRGRRTRLERELDRVARYAAADSVQFSDGWLRET